MRSRKTLVALEIARMQQNFYSIFWFAAESIDSLQDWYNRASFCIAPGRFNEYSRDHYRAVTKWLLDPANGKWILIFDNANPMLNFKDILPENVPWGKILITSRAADIMIGRKRPNDPLVFVPMPPLSTDEAFKLFMLRCANLELTQAQKSEVSSLSSSLRSNPLAIMLASVHFQTFQRTSDLDPTPYASSENSNDLIQHLISLLVEDARVNQRMVLKFIALLSRSTVSLDIVNLCQRSRRRLRDVQKATEFLSTSNTGSAIQQWVSMGLLQRQTSPSGPVLVIPDYVKTAVEQELTNDPEQIEIILKLGLRLVASAPDESGLPSTEGIAKSISKTVASFRNLCIAVRDLSILFPDDTGNYLQLAALHYLGKTANEGVLLFKKLFWRQWLSSFQYPPPAYRNGKESSSIAIPIFRWPTWLETPFQSNDDPEDLDSKAVVHNALVAKLWDQLELAILLSGMGRAWHGVREHIFGFARQNFYSEFPEDQKASFIDFIDKGGADGLHVALLKVTRSDEFQQEAMDRIDSDSVDDVVQMIWAVSHPYIASLSEEAIQQAVSKALEGTMQEIFTEAASAMAEALLPIQDIINTVLKGPLEVPSNGESAEKLVRFIVSTVGEQYIRQRCLTMAEGFCEYLDIAQIRMAAKVCLHLAYAAMDATEPTQEVDWEWVCAIVELFREGVIPVERIPGRTGEVAGQRMLYWLDEACECRTAWGARPDVPVYDFRNQGQWEETRVLMGAESRSWILS